MARPTDKPRVRGIRAGDGTAADALRASKQWAATRQATLAIRIKGSLKRRLG